MLAVAFDRTIVLGLIVKNPARTIGNVKRKNTKLIFGLWTNLKGSSLYFTKEIATNIIYLFPTGYYL